VKAFPVLIASALCALLYARMANAQTLLDRNEVTHRNCLRVMEAPLTPQNRKPEEALLHSKCFDLMMARRFQSKQELPNLSTETSLANYARMFFSMAEDGTEYELEPEFSKKCDGFPICTANLTLLATDGVHTNKEESLGRLINVVIHDTGRWLTLKGGDFSCNLQQKKTGNPR
jgi:hypothetical protein